MIAPCGSDFLTLSIRLFAGRYAFTSALDTVKYAADSKVSDCFLDSSVNSFISLVASAAIIGEEILGQPNPDTFDMLGDGGSQLNGETVELSAIGFY